MPKDKGSIGVPSVKGMGSAFGDWAVGAGGGLVYSIGRAIFGSGLIGSLAAPILAGSVIKGARGTALATVAGFLAFSGIAGGTAQAAPQSGSRWIE